MLEPLIFDVNGLFHRYRMNLLPMNVSLIQNRTPFLFYTGPIMVSNWLKFQNSSETTPRVGWCVPYMTL